MTLFKAKIRLAVSLAPRVSDSKRVGKGALRGVLGVVAIPTFSLPDRTEADTRDLPHMKLGNGNPQLKHMLR